MTTAFAVRLERDIIRVSGPDAASYLQGQLSQDVQALPTDACAYTFVLQPQGKVDAWFRITRLAEDAFVCDVDAGYGPTIVARLLRFKLRVKVDIETVPWELVAVRGIASSAVDGVALGASIAAPVAWGGTVGVDLLGPAVALPAGVPVGDTASYEAWRVAAGVPAMGTELDESTIPAEAGVVDVSVSFTKGCYTGQELVARVDSRGNRTPRKLRRVVLAAGAEAAPGQSLLADDGHEVGVLTSVAGGLALAYVRREVEPPATVTLAGTAHPVTVEPLPTP
jgi:folate-binding protein YgfZ